MAPGCRLSSNKARCPFTLKLRSPIVPALAAERQGKFLQMSELLYSNQGHLDLPALLTYARQIHLDIPRFRRDLNSPEVAAHLETDIEESRAMAIDQTPTMYANGRPLIGQQSEEALSTIFDQQLTAAARMAAAAAQPAAKQISPALDAEIKASPLAEQGPANAPLTIVEFTDFSCPFCRLSVEPMEKLVAARAGAESAGSSERSPLDIHPDSELATEAALAAGDQGQFWQMHDLLFANQKHLKLEDLRRYADSLHPEHEALRRSPHHTSLRRADRRRPRPR